MCGRTVYNFTDNEVVADKSFNITKVENNFKPNFNVSPTQQIPVIIPGSRILTTFRWGLIPFWAKDKKIGYKMINARSETLIDKPIFKSILKNKRCLVLASGFYEWDNKKHPHLFQIKNKKIIAFAGFWDEWEDKETNNKIKTCTIITCEPNKFMNRFHDRMPVILKEKEFNIWLTSEEFSEYRSVLRPINEELMTEYEVSTEVNSPKNNKKELLEPIENESKQNYLF